MKYFVMINHPSIGVVVPLNNDKGVALFTTIEKAYKEASKSFTSNKYGFDIYPVPIRPRSQRKVKSENKI